eukprot:5956197-Amphidinium_carterae.1
MAYELPWENGLLGFILNNKPLVPLPEVPQLGDFVTSSTNRRQRDETDEADGEAPNNKKVRWTPKKCVLRKGWQATEDDLRQRALVGWLDIAECAAEESELFKQLRSARDGDEMRTTLEDNFRGKATSTLRKRLSAATLYIRWCSGVGVAPFPFYETV